MTALSRGAARSERERLAEIMDDLAAEEPKVFARVAPELQPLVTRTAADYRTIASLLRAPLSREAVEKVVRQVVSQHSDPEVVGPGDVAMLASNLTDRLMEALNQ